MYAPAMVNVNVVNVYAACANRADLCAFLVDSGRFVLFKYAVKYDPIFEINQGRACRDQSPEVLCQNSYAISVG